MKTIFTTIICFALSFGTLAQGSINTKVNTRKVLGNNNAVKAVIDSKVNITDLKGAKYTKSLKQSKLPLLGISKEDLSKNARKSLKITPQRPVHTNLYISFYGEYSKDAFILNYRPKAKDGKSYKYSGFINFNAQRGKEYRVKIRLDMGIRDGAYRALRNSGASQQGTVFLELGDMEYRAEVNGRQNEINFVFTARTAGFVTIGVSPLQKTTGEKSIQVPQGFHPMVPTAPVVPGYSSDALAIKSIQVDEI